MKDKWSAQDYNANASFVYSKRFTNAVVDLLDPSKQDHILDLGCGSGELTLDIAPRVASVLGVDLSTDLLSKARENITAAGPAAGGNIELVQLDGQELATLPKERHGTMDAVFSR